MSDFNNHVFESMPAELLAAMLKAEANDDEKLVANSSHLLQMAAESAPSLASLSGLRASQSTSGIRESSIQGASSEKLEDEVAEMTALARWIQRGGSSSSSNSGGHEPPLFRKHTLEHAPCANARAAEAWRCSNTTNLKECANCHLVLYCSKECQRQHWPTHKQDCKDPIRANDWKPKWVLQKRSPTFIGASQGPWIESIEPLGLGMSLWGNMPAQDILNYSMNETDCSRDLDLAFVASGDLRNVLTTVNRLPSDYTGKLTIVVNDHNPNVAIRTMLLLQLLCNAVDQHRGCDIALHVWYSTFIPEDYATQLYSSLLLSLLDLSADDGVHRFNLGGGGASLSVAFSRESMGLAYEMASSTYDLTEASKEVDRVRFAPSRVDRHERGYCRMEPSHRLACLEFRRFGLVLPFGAANNWFNTPNRTLFSPAGRWLQNDLADPLDSWDPAQVVTAGKRHGIPREDLYGCLYFYLSEQLEEFRSRIARFKISFKILDRDLLALPSTIRSGELERAGVPAGQRFDRVDVSNVMDKQYTGVRATLTKWGPMLKDTAHAAVVGYFMNWAPDNEGGRPGEKELGSLVDRAIKEGKIPNAPKGASTATQMAYAMTLPAFFDHFNALHDSSKGFEKYLNSEELEAVLRCSGLRRRCEHTIFPHRLYAPLDAPPTTLPIFSDQEAWYLRANIGAPMWSERFVEFTKA